MMLSKVLEQIAEKVISLDEASLTALLPEFKRRMESFEPTREWEKAVIIYFLINSVRVKNSLFNENVIKNQDDKIEKAEKECKNTTKPDRESNLKLVKS
jgi:hypothetical protein